MSDRWSKRHAPELAEPGEGGDVWMITHDGEDVADSFGEGFTQRCVDDLNAQEAASDGR